MTARDNLHAIVTDAEFMAARVRDAARWLNEALMLAEKTGLRFSVTVSHRSPVCVIVEEKFTSNDRGPSE